MHIFQRNVEVCLTKSGAPLLLTICRRYECLEQVPYGRTFGNKRVRPSRRCGLADVVTRRCLHDWSRDAAGIPSLDHVCFAGTRAAVTEGSASVVYQPSASLPSVTRHICMANVAIRRPDAGTPLTEPV
jgi:hypothetical protein